MVHIFNHNYNGELYNFLWDVESGSLHNVDDAAFLCAKKRYSRTFDTEEEAKFKAIDKELVKQINNEFDLLEKEGSLNAPPQITEFHKDADEVKALCLNVCHDCNMRCSYCFADGGSYHTAERAYMSKEVARKAVDFLIENSGKRKNLEIDFFGGEPLLNLSVIKDTVEYAKQQAKQNGKFFNFTTTTNCVLLDDQTIDYLNKEMCNVVLSLDGREETHNKVRRCLDKNMGYKQILENAKKMKKTRGDKSYYVRGTFTALNLDFSKDILKLNDEGFDQISVEPVVTNIPSLEIKDENIEQIKKEYQTFANEYLNRRQTDKWFNFFHFMNDLETGPCVNKRMTGCGAGTEYLSVSPNGDIFPCHQFVGISEFKIGNVFKSIDRQDVRQRFSGVSVLSKPECKECFAKYYCGGGCMANSYKYGKGLDSIYEKGCELTRKRFELSLAINGIEKIMEQKGNG